MSNTQVILFGQDPTPGIVAVETGPTSARIYRRDGEQIVTEDREFRRWLLSMEKHELQNAQWTQLEGEGYRWLAEFPDLSSYTNARFRLRDSHAAFMSCPSDIRQYLTRSGQTLYKGMGYDDVHRLQLDIETMGLKPDVPQNEIFLVTISDNRGFETAIAGDEPDILKKTVSVIQERDPDVIEGHNILSFDLPYLVTRARRHGIRLQFGRDFSEPTFGAQQNCQIGYFSRPYVPVNIAGRQVIDTLLAVQRYDVAKGSLQSHGLKAVCQALGIAEEDRELIPHTQIADEWRSNPDRVIKYAIQDVRETRALAALICPPEFYLAQMIPEAYSRAATSGTGERINFIFIREYLRQGRAIPEQSKPESVPGGYTDVRATGVIEHIVKCDVESLYPSIMLTKKIEPKNDVLHVFLPALEELTRRRFDAKRKAREASGRERAYWDGLQGSYKILINSFYGYLGGPFNFNDYSAAAQVTTTGQEMVKSIVDELEKTGSLVVEIDTDGVYFRPPSNIESEEQEREYIDKIGSILPEGIRLAHDGRYQAMISLKMKNYVLLTYGGEMIFRGSSLRSRADERFGLEFISQAADCLLHGRRDEVLGLYNSILQAINSGELPLEKFARRERITEKTFVSQSKKRVAKAVSGAKIGEYVSVYQRQDGSIGLTQDYSHDEDKQHLREKLYKFACRLKEAFGSDFDVMFPKPSAKSKREAEGQQTLGLFD